MATAFVLFLANDVVSAAFRLIRCVSENRLAPEPHITVRYPVDKLQKNDLTEYRAAKVTSLDIIEPGCFGPPLDVQNSPSTVFLRCESELLESLAYKPDYPDSVFHVTLYNGFDSAFAQRLLTVLKGFRWHFRFPMGKGVSLTEIDIGKNALKRAKLTTFPKKLKDLFFEITDRRLTLHNINGLSESSRLKVIRAICRLLNLSDFGFQKVRLPRYKGSIQFRVTDLRPIQKPLSDDSNLDWLQLSTADGHKLESSIANRTGLFLTPPELARDIIARALELIDSSSPIDFGDPAIGNGVFFGALYKSTKGKRISSAIGIEIDPSRAKATQQKWGPYGLTLVTSDYLNFEGLAKRTLIVGNPPYVRYQHIPSNEGRSLRKLVQRQLGIKPSGQSGLYVYFMLLSHNWMAPGAVAAWLIPAEFMETKYGAALRRYLTEHVQLLQIHKFNPASVQFENALVSSAVILFKNCLPRSDMPVIFSANGSIRSPWRTDAISLDLLRQKEKWTYLQSTADESCESGAVLGDVFDVCRGLATGANWFFIMERSVARERGIPERALRPLLPKARLLRSNIVESRDDGYPVVHPQLCVLDSDLDIREIRQSYPDLLSYLESAPESVRSGRLVRSRSLWYQQERRDPPPFLCTYMGRGGDNSAPFRFIWNKSQAVATNTYLLLYPKPWLKNLLADRPDLYARLFALLEGIDSSHFYERGRVYGGGLYKIEPRELKGIPIGNLPIWLELPDSKALELLA